MNNENNEKLNNSVSGVKKRNTVKTVALCLIVIFCIFTAGLGILSCLTADREFSESENRVLASMPRFSWSSVLSGSFMKDFETYLADQFPLRDGAISLKTLTDRVLGKRQENGVYIGDNNFLFDEQTDFVKEDNIGKIQAIDEFCEKYPTAKKLFAIAPNSSYIYSEYLPYSLTLPDQQNQIEQIYASLKCKTLTKADVTGILQREKEKGTQLFYKTDHHWTTRAAYSVFSAIIKHWKLDKDDVKFRGFPVTADFEGTLSGKSGVHSAKDTIEIIVPQKSVGSYIVNYESQQRKTTTLFENSKLAEKNKYEIFLGGNYDKVVISTDAENLNTLLIVKDSFANCMLPMFTPYFSKIVVIDPRYLTDSMEKIMGDNDFTHILFLYNLNTFLGDTSIVSAFSEE